MDDPQSGICEHCHPGSPGRSIACPGCRRERHSSGAGECARTQRLGQRSQRHRQCGQSACDNAAGHKPGSRTHRIPSYGWLPNVAGAKSRQYETNATCGIQIWSRGSSSDRQGASEVARPQDSKHLQGMLNPLLRIGLQPAGHHRRLGCSSVIGKISRRSSRPRSHIASLTARARAARSGTPTVLQPQEAPLIAGLEVLFSSPEYALPTVRFPVDNPATITHYPVFRTCDFRGGCGRIEP